MGTVKAVILIACVIGIVSAYFEIAAPEGSLKKQLNVLLGLVTLLAVITPFAGSGFKVSFDDFRFNDNDILSEEKITDEAESLAVEKAEKKVEEYFQSKLNKNGIEIKEITADLTVNENGEVEISSIKINIVSSDDKDKTESLIREDLKDTEIIINAED